MWKNEEDGPRTESNLDEGDCIIAEENKDHKWKEQDCNSKKMFICQLEKENTSGMYQTILLAKMLFSFSRVSNN